MISGLRALPRVQTERNRQRDEGSPFADAHMNCTECPQMFDAVARAEMRCGWMPTSEWLDSGMPNHAEAVCPGYSIQLPEVIEAARALSWRNHGGLEPLYGREEFPLPPQAAAYIDVLDGAVKASEADEMRRIREESKRGT